jgi:hypothetical protein
MALDLTGQPYIDRDDFENIKAAGRFGRWSDEATMLHRDGYCVIRLDDPDFLRMAETVVEDLKPCLADQLDLWLRGEAGPPRLQDGWKQHASIRSLALQPIILDLLHQLYGREPFAFQTLNFAVGSQQHFHSDAVHFHSYPHGFMCGVWIALQDVDVASGPLHYFPGSHRLPYLSSRSLGLSESEVAAKEHPQTFFEPLWQQAVDTKGLNSQRFLPQRGDILIWHANLLHGGEMVQDRDSRRWSQVVHYFFADCLYTTPMRCFAPDQGGTFLRNPLDIATGMTRYSPDAWEAMGLTAAKQPAKLQRRGRTLQQRVRGKDETAPFN